MELTEFIAAVDLGSSKIVGIVGSKRDDGALIIHALEKEETEGCIKRGCIQNVDETASKVKRLISKLENRAKCKIGQIYVGLSGQSVQSINHKVTRPLNEETPITDKIIQSLKDVSMQLPVGNKEILEIVPSEYVIDGRRITQPIGVYGSEVEASHTIIVGRPSLKKNLNRVMEKIHISLAGYILSPLCSAKVLSEPDKSLGCVLLDFGAGTTTLSIYKDGLLRYMSAIPLGGNTITKDIASLQLLENEAEKIKIYYGNVNPEIDESETQTIKHVANTNIDTPEIQVRTLHHVVLCRSEEIIENIINQIRLAGFENKQLSVGLILTGGASNMKGLTTLLRKKMDMEVKMGVFQNAIISSQYPEIGKDPSYSVLLGLLQMGTKNCVKIEEPPVDENTQHVNSQLDRQGKNKKSFFERTFGMLNNDNDTKLD